VRSTELHMPSALVRLPNPQQLGNGILCSPSDCCDNRFRVAPRFKRSLAAALGIKILARMFSDSIVPHRDRGTKGLPAFGKFSVFAL